MKLKALKTQRAALLVDAAACKGADGQFADDAARAAFDEIMAKVDALDGQIRAAGRPRPDPEPEPDLDPEPGPDPEPPVAAETRAQIIAEERARVDGITAAVRIAGLDAVVATDLVKRGVTLAAARADIFTKMAERSNANPTNGRIAVGEAEQEKWLRGALNWLLVKGGVADLVARATKTELSALDPGEFRGMTLVDLARLSLDRGGHQTRGLDKMRIVSDAFVTRSNITQTTSDFAVLLESAFGKILLASYAIMTDTWKRFSAQGTVSDFRAHGRYRMSSFGSLDAVNEAGEFKNKPITDGEKATIQATTRGNIINVSRQMIVNDDMGVFSTLLKMLGRAAALSVEADVYALLAQNAGLGPTMADGLTLFHASHGNIVTGAALSAAALDADSAAMALQKDVSSNDYIDLTPSILLVPRGLLGAAQVINKSTTDPDTLANKAQNKPNIAMGMFSDIVGSPRISGTRRYLFADPGLAPVIEVAFLEGATAPVLETQDGWRVDGTEMKVRFDYGVAAVDYRGAVTNAGV